MNHPPYRTSSGSACHCQPGQQWLVTPIAQQEKRRQEKKWLSSQRTSQRQASARELSFLSFPSHNLTDRRTRASPAPTQISSPHLPPPDLPPTMDSAAGAGGLTAIRLPYRHLRDAEMELVSLNRSPRARASTGEGPPKQPDQDHVERRASSTRKLVLACMVAAGVQFGWALQLSLLTPYIQTLGIDHAMASFIWLCGPITGFVVQPCVGVWSDKCRSKYGRRRPFILAGCLMICASVTLIGFSADLGYILGDTTQHCSTYKGSRYRAAVVFILGFWMLDLANNTVQGPARALLADLSGPNQCNSANAIFCSWMAVGNVLGFSSGASGNWHKWFPFLMTRACCEACGNLKAAFLVAVVFLLFCLSVTLYFAEEIPLEPKDAQRLSDSAPLLNGSRGDGCASNEQSNGRLPNGHADGNNVSANSNSEDFTDANSNSTRDNEVFNDGPGAVLVNILTSMRHLPPGMHSVLLVMGLTWLSWFPFFLFDTDWMGREVYHGDPNGDLSERKAYDNGVREGAFGLLLNSVVLGIGSFLVDPLCRIIGARLVWTISNFTVFICMMATTILSWISSDLYSSALHRIIGANKTVRNSALIVFSLLGLPLSITYSVPFSVTAELTAGTGGGQGLATGVLNLAIVVPQIVVSLGAGPWDALFGGGNIPAFALASVFSLAAGVLAVLKLPKLSNSYRSAGFHGFG